MKRSICLLCLCVFLLIPTACGDSKSQSDTNTQSTDTSEVRSTDTQPADTAEAGSTDSQSASSSQVPDTDSLKIKVQPQSLTVNEGDTASFSVEAEGGKAPYDYMWLTTSAEGEMPANQELQTNTVSFPNVDMSFNGAVYFCRVTDADNNMVESEKVTVTVIPSPKAKTVTVTFMTEECAAPISPMEFEEGKPIGTLPIPEFKEKGYKFSCWISDGTVIDSGSILTEDRELIPMWVEDGTFIDIYFYLDDGTYFTSKRVDKGTPFGTLPTPPDKPGYIFMAWADRHGMPFYPESTMYEDISLYATWRLPD